MAPTVTTPRERRGRAPLGASCSAGPSHRRDRVGGARTRATRHTSTASTDTASPIHTERCGVHRSTTSIVPAWPGRTVHPLANPFTSVRRTERVAVDRRLPAVVVALAEHQPERRAVGAHAQVVRVGGRVGDPHARARLADRRAGGRDRRRAAARRSDDSTSRSTSKPVQPPRRSATVCVPCGRAAARARTASTVETAAGVAARRRGSPPGTAAPSTVTRSVRHPVSMVAGAAGTGTPGQGGLGDRDGQRAPVLTRAPVFDQLRPVAVELDAGGPCRSPGRSASSTVRTVPSRARARHVRERQRARGLPSATSVIWVGMECCRSATIDEPQLVDGLCGAGSDTSIHAAPGFADRRRSTRSSDRGRTRATRGRPRRPSRCDDDGVLRARRGGPHRAVDHRVGRVRFDARGAREQERARRRGARTAGRGSAPRRVGGTGRCAAGSARRRAGGRRPPGATCFARSTGRRTVSVMRGVAEADLGEADAVEALRRRLVRCCAISTSTRRRGPGRDRDGLARGGEGRRVERDGDRIALVERELHLRRSNGRSGRPATAARVTWSMVCGWSAWMVRC